MMYNKTALYFVPLRFIRQEWTVAPSIFNIKAPELAHCLLWMKLGLVEVYQIYFHGSMALSDDGVTYKTFGNSEKNNGVRQEENNRKNRK